MQTNAIPKHLNKETPLETAERIVKEERKKKRKNNKEVQKSEGPLKDKNSHNKYAYRGKDFYLADGKVKCHQTVSGTLYLYDRNGCMTRVTPEILNRIEAELGPRDKEGGSEAPAKN